MQGQSFYYQSTSCFGYYEMRLFNGNKLRWKSTSQPKNFQHKGNQKFSIRGSPKAKGRFVYLTPSHLQLVLDDKIVIDFYFLFYFDGEGGVHSEWRKIVPIGALSENGIRGRKVGYFAEGLNKKGPGKSG